MRARTAVWAVAGLLVAGQVVAAPSAYRVVPTKAASDAPTGSPAHSGNSPGRSRRQASITMKPNGGSTGAGAMNGSQGVSDPSMIVSHGRP